MLDRKLRHGDVLIHNHTLHRVHGIVTPLDLVELCRVRHPDDQCGNYRYEVRLSQLRLALFAKRVALYREGPEEDPRWKDSNISPTACKTRDSESSTSELATLPA